MVMMIKVTMSLFQVKGLKNEENKKIICQLEFEKIG